jgi:predicted glycosyltransferase
MVKKLRKKNRVLCTSREYREVTKLAKIRHFNLKIVGKHGGGNTSDKLTASLDRMKILSKIVEKFAPDVTVSFCSPEASRIAFGLGINHVAFSDSPHASAVMRLSVPLVQKLLIPWVIPKKEFIKYGIGRKNIISYKAIDAASITQRKIAAKTKIPFSEKKKNILIRIEEDQAAYRSKSKIIPIIRAIVKEFDSENILVLGRYHSQIQKLNQTFGKKIKVLKMSYDGKLLLTKSDVFIGSGGTMTAESALLGVPTISYNAVPNFIEEYLVRKNLVKRKTNPNEVVSTINQFFATSNSSHKKRVKDTLKSMEDPYLALEKTIKSISKK